FLARLMRRRCNQVLQHLDVACLHRLRVDLDAEHLLAAVHLHHYGAATRRALHHRLLHLFLQAFVLPFCLRHEFLNIECHCCLSKLRLLAIVDNRSYLRSEFFFHPAHHRILLRAAAAATVARHRSMRRSLRRPSWKHFQLHWPAQHRCGGVGDDSFCLVTQRHVNHCWRRSNFDHQFVSFLWPPPAFHHVKNHALTGRDNRLPNRITQVDMACSLEGRTQLRFHRKLGRRARSRRSHHYYRCRARCNLWLGRKLRIRPALA